MFTVGNGRRGLMFLQSSEDAWELFRVGLPDVNRNVEIHNLSGLEYWGIDPMTANRLKDEAIKMANLGSPAPRSPRHWACCPMRTA